MRRRGMKWSEERKGKKGKTQGTLDIAERKTNWW